MKTRDRLKLWIVKWRWELGIGLGAAAMRLWRLGSLPPGASPSEAASGLGSLSLLHGGHLWSGSVTPVNLVYSWLDAPFLAIGTGLFWLRIVAAAAGLAAVAGVYLWLRQIRGHRDALIGAAVMAALAWAVGLSREAGPVSLVPAITAWWLWLASRPAGKGSQYGLAVVSALGFYVSSGLWWLWAGFIVVTAAQRRWRPSDLPPGLLWLVLIAPGGIWAALHPAQLSAMFAFGGAFGRLGQFVAHTITAGGDWQATVGAQPLLNAFYAIMAILGLAVSFLRFRASQAVLGVLLAGLLAGMFSPDSSGFAVALVALVAMVTIGIATMLEWWYATFPINAAARTSGRAAVGLLLALAAYQGYVQYFVAFANSTQTFAVYREDAWLMGADAKRHPQAAIVTDQAARQIITYRTFPAVPHFVTIKNLSSAKYSYYLIGYQQRAEAETVLAGSAPGGKLIPHTSPFDSRDLFYSYEVKR